MSDECSEATLRINGLARQMRRWRVSDLIERPKSIGQAWRKLIQQQAEIERLEAALAESCDENRTVVLEEGPFSTDMCPLAGRQQAEIERLKTALRKICSTEKRLTNHGYEIARQALEDDE